MKSALSLEIMFVYAEAITHSGQYEASRVIFDGLGQLGVRVYKNPMPALRRRRFRVVALAVYVCRLLVAWLRSARLLINRDMKLHLNMGQTPFSLIRDAMSLVAAASFGGTWRIAVSLHGSNFMQWPERAFVARCFRVLLNKASIVTVLSERQRQRLIGLGVRSRIVVVLNTSNAPVAEDHDLRTRHCGSGEIHVLHLSSLIDTKGFVVFMEALDLMARTWGAPLRATLCGQYVGSQFATSRFASESESNCWIEDMIAKINQSEMVKVAWVKGATGAQKWALYKAAHIFVFPSVYSVEAQPIVLLEAMATGVAIITSRAGEIESMLSTQECERIDSVDAESVARSIAFLASSADSRYEKTKAALRRYNSEYSTAAHVQQWRGMFYDMRR